ncbi:MAG: hypothetical protein KZQ94_07575 [Candidatus Thiodiazotropha sp. (ex Troendleina suluensis)]|nr:hypothetical protein [Candidatus Thiodiazotropha sp. (ex Troendleina suluensis)]
MPIYLIDNKKIVPIQRTTFALQGLRERYDLQALLKSQIDVISPDTLIVAEEFGGWEDSRRRIDLLGIDKGGNLVVIELKRTEDGGHMDLQAIRYAAMISTLTFDKLVTIYAQYLKDNNIDRDATETLLEFLDWNDPDEEQFGQEVKIVLASAEFSKELTTSVMWLNDYGLDIRCVRMHPYTSEGQTFLDVQTVIPIPEVADYQVRIREKKQRERESRNSTRDFTKYDVQIADHEYAALSKRWIMFRLVSGILQNGGTPEKIMDAIPWRKNRLFEVIEGTLSSDEVYEIIMQDDPGGTIPRAKRYFCGDGEIFHADGKTYVLSNQWGRATLDAVDSLMKVFPHLNIKIRPSHPQ